MAQGYNKMIKKSDGEEYMISPFAPINLPQLEKAEINHRARAGSEGSDGRESKASGLQVGSKRQKTSDQEPISSERI